MKLLQIGVITHFQVTPLFSMRTVSLVSSQSCRSVDAHAWCKRVLRHRIFAMVIFATHCGQVSLHVNLDVARRIETVRGSTWRERVTRTRTRVTLIFDNFPQSLTFCEILTSKFHSVYMDCQRLWEIVKDLAFTFRKLLKIACPIVKDCICLVLATRSLRLILHETVGSLNTRLCFGSLILISFFWVKYLQTHPGNNKD